MVSLNNSRPVIKTLSKGKIIYDSDRSNYSTTCVVSYTSDFGPKFVKCGLVSVIAYVTVTTYACQVINKLNIY